MAKRRRYGDAWKDVQIDAEQNDAVFDRFFKRTQHDPEPPDAAEEAARPAGEAPVRPSPKVKTPPPARREKRLQPEATVRSITPALPNLLPAADASADVDTLKRQYRLSKGEAAVLRYLIQRSRENGGSECYAKIPQLADECQMTHRGCQFALRNLESRGFIVRLRDYDPANRLGIQFRLTLPTA
ncbi:MAG TPA: hypothetical protein VGB98_21790 [Pyrinomonadaceae bacterium]|jgi:DNA-binding MarR family transcriptional regulator